MLLSYCVKEPAVALAEKGYHILLEKPMAVSFPMCLSHFVIINYPLEKSYTQIVFFHCSFLQCLMTKTKMMMMMMMMTIIFTVV